MKTTANPSQILDRTTIVYMVLLITAGLAILLGSHYGIVSLDRIEKFWPVGLVAAGLTQLLSWQIEKSRNI